MLTHAITGTFANGNQRFADRRVLRLEAQVSADDAREGALIHNLSSTGMLLSARSGLRVGESITIELAGGESREAQIVWADEELFGCRFDVPLSQASLSAAYLRSQPEAAPKVRVPEPTAQLARLQQHWAMEGAATSAVIERLPSSADAVAKLPIGQRAWVIIGLSAGTWAASAAIAYLAWQLLA